MEMQRVVRRVMALTASVGFVTCLAACGEPVAPPPSASDPQMGFLAQEYMNEVLGHMQRASIHRHTVDWVRFRSDAFVRVNGAIQPRDTWASLKVIAKELDPHTHFLTVEELTQQRTDPPPAPRLVPHGRVFGGVGYVYVAAFGGLNTTARVDSTHAMIREVDERLPGGACGWIVDVRDNTGGNMWPMIAGVAPILGQGVVGHFSLIESPAVAWLVTQAGAGSDSRIHASASVPYQLRRPNGPVAILHDSVTASAGEAVVIAFRGRANTRTFGAATRGLSTGNQGFRLSDLSILNVTNSIMADRAGRRLGGRIAPDSLVTLPSFTPGEEDELIRVASRWLRAQPACSGS